jgi:NADPH:quinone reductase-like Zn-dependent oxidoreductase
MSGSWAEFSVANVDNIWIIDEDVPIECSSSGIVNPLTVIGIVETFKKSSCHGVKGKGLINTAAASALGRMLVKYCKR